jgi:hypothetical protein
VKMLEATTLSRAIYGNPVVVKMLCVKRMRASDHAASMLRVHIIQTAPEKLVVVVEWLLSAETARHRHSKTDTSADEMVVLLHLTIGRLHLHCGRRAILSSSEIRDAAGEGALPRRCPNASGAGVGLTMSSRSGSSLAPRNATHA